MEGTEERRNGRGGEGTRLLVVAIERRNEKDERASAHLQARREMKEREGRIGLVKNDILVRMQIENRRRGAK